MIWLSATYYEEYDVSCMSLENCPQHLVSESDDETSLRCYHAATLAATATFGSKGGFGFGSMMTRSNATFPAGT